MAAPFPKHALDFLDHDPEAVRLVTDFLEGIVKHPEVHDNRFMIKGVFSPRPSTRTGTQYFLAEKRGSSAIDNHRVLRADITGPLLARGWIQADPTSGKARSWLMFTPAAIEWYETYGGPNDDIVRRAIGRAIAEAGSNGLPLPQLSKIAEQLGVDRSRVEEQVQDLVQLRVVSQTGVAEPLRIETLGGRIWKVREFGPVADLPPEVLRVSTEIPLSAVPSLVRPRSALRIPTGEAGSYDVFISYASEDEATVARPLTNSLLSAGLNVWYAELTLRIGDSLRRKIGEGIADSRFAVIVLSENYLREGWTNYELDGVVSRTVSGEQVILPIWHNISKSQVVDVSPSLADKVARKTAQHTIEEIAAEIIQRIRDAP